MKSRKSLFSLVIGAIVLAGSLSAISVAYGEFGNSRQAVDFYNGHTHENEQTVGAPGHSGGTDKYGCHNRSVPYHCH